jgi:hypothetical protein
MTLLHFVSGPSLIKPHELATFRLGPGEAEWSEDRRALFIPRLYLAAPVVRRVVTGGTLYGALHDAYLLERAEHEASCYHGALNYVWGDLQLFETGSPTVTRAIFMCGAIVLPDLTIIGRYLKEMPKHCGSRL